MKKRREFVSKIYVYLYEGIKFCYLYINYFPNICLMTVNKFGKNDNKHWFRFKNKIIVVRLSEMYRLSYWREEYDKVYRI